MYGKLSGVTLTPTALKVLEASNPEGVLRSPQAASLFAKNDVLETNNI